jgi:hypothetical protein
MVKSIQGGSPLSRPKQAPAVLQQCFLLFFYFEISIAFLYSTRALMLSGGVLCSPPFLFVALLLLIDD